MYFEWTHLLINLKFWVSDVLSHIIFWTNYVLKKMTGFCKIDIVPRAAECEPIGCILHHIKPLGEPQCAKGALGWNNKFLRSVRDFEGWFCYKPTSSRTPSEQNLDFTENSKNSWILEVHNRWLDFLKFPFQEMCTSNLGFQFYCNEEKTTHCFYAFCDGRNGKNVSIFSFMLDGLAANLNSALF